LRRSGPNLVQTYCSF